VENIENQKIEEYLAKLQSMKQQDFIDETKQIKNKISNKMAYFICDEVNRVYNTKSFNPEKFNELISFSLETLIDKYIKELTIDLEQLPEDDIKRKRQVQYENIITEITNKIITDVNTHIKFKEALTNLNYGRGYHNVANANQIKKLDDLEMFIRQCVKKNTIQLNEMVDEMYNTVLMEYERRKQEFFTNISMTKMETMSPNEAAFIEGPSRALDPNVIFGEPVVSQNEAAFIEGPSRTLDPNAIFGEPTVTPQEHSSIKDLPALDPNCIFEEYESENAKRFK